MLKMPKFLHVFRRSFRQLRTRPPVTTGSYVTNADGTIVDTELGMLHLVSPMHPSGYRCNLPFLGDVLVSLRADQLSSNLSFLRTIVGAIKLHDHLYRQFAAQDVWVFHRYLFKGPKLRPKELATRFKLFWIQPLFARDPNLGANLWYRCENLIPNARVCVTLDQKARYYSAGVG